MKKILIYIMVGMILLLPGNVFAKETEIVTLDKCVDGDTANFKNSSGLVYKTRFLAIDTPETVHPTIGVEAFGKEASTFTCEMLTNAKEIKLEYDENSDKEDKYGRRLAWVWVDGLLLQEEIIKNGYAEVAYLYEDYLYTSLLQDAEAVAKVEKKGMWQEQTEKVVEETEKESTKDTLRKNDKTFIEDLLDNLLAQVFEYIDSLLEKLIKFIESML
ncbi:MAG: thermonuclease family protein [Firmicutes bacterium]|nr:thermonuclease family protein [Bacillota bacterium]